MLGLLKGRHEAKDKERDRLEGRRAKRIETRHAAYTVFMAQSRTALVKLTAALTVPVSAPEDEWHDAITDARNAAEEMYDGYVDLALAGPESFAKEAERLWQRAIRAADQVETLWSRRDPEESGATVTSLFVDEDPDRLFELVEQQKKVIGLARVQLGGDVIDT
ncbi:hypothetical protein ACFT7S_29790 [Streptomyces sp. NPDC057136]|uniref:hypothetical protein n=1 Tax=Streptomyces sp. NPDC057136 TaxID=3346029 RepID=UPI00363BC150